MSAPIISHVTCNGRPLCWFGRYTYCGFESFAAAKRHAASYKDWRYKAVRGPCPESAKELNQ